MKIIDKGVLDPSYLDFTIPSDFARNHLYWIPQYGHFYCNHDYSIRRSYLDLFLFIYVVDGSLQVESRGSAFTATKDQIILLDCHYPHAYFCNTYADILWFHFTGNNSQAYTNYLFEKNGILFSGEHIPPLQTYFHAVVSSASSTVIHEHQISLNIARILCSLATPSSSVHTIGHPSLEPVLSYIRNHYEEELRLEHLSSLCGLSVSHFIRIFRKYMECTPHEYLLSFRLRQAKQMLWSTSDSIDEISARCGFHSASHFVRAFRKKEKMTPTQFRNIEF